MTAITSRPFDRRRFLHAAGVLSGTALGLRCTPVPPLEALQGTPLDRGMMGPAAFVALVYTTVR